MAANAQPDNSVANRLLAIARLATLAWFFMSLLFSLIAISGKWQARHILTPGNDSGFAFYGWTEPQLQTMMARLEIQPETVTGTMLAFSVVSLVFFFGIGGLLFWRKSDAWIGLLGTFVLWATGPGFSNLLLTQAQIPNWAITLYSLSAVFTWPTFFIILYLFPTGKFVPEFTRLLFVVPYILFGAVRFFPDNANVQSIGIVIFITYAAGGLASQIYRYWKVSTPTERQQTKWVVFALGVFVSVIVAQNTFLPLLIGPVGTPTRFWYEFLGNGVLSALLSALIPLAIGISILRYRLFDIDLLIRRTLQYSVISGLLALVYFGSVVVLQRIFTALTGQGQNQLVAVVSTLALAALFAPLRRRVQDVIDRRFYRRKYDAAKTLAAFAATVRDETDLDKLTASLIAVVQETMQPEHVSLWLRATDDKVKR
jgi:hypothetical protein